MNDSEIKQLISDTVNTTVLKLKAAGLLRDGTMTAEQKTEALLQQYTTLKEVDEPYARRVVQEIDACLASIEGEPYADVIRLYYFGGLKNTGCAMTLICDERTARRYRREYVRKFSARLASEDFIRELLM